MDGKINNLSRPSVVRPKQPSSRSYTVEIVCGFESSAETVANFAVPVVISCSCSNYCSAYSESKSMSPNVYMPIVKHEFSKIAPIVVLCASSSSSL